MVFYAKFPKNNFFAWKSLEPLKIFWGVSFRPNPVRSVSEINTWKSVLISLLVIVLLISFTLTMYIFFVKLDGFAFSQEEGGAVSQTDVIRAYDTNIPKPDGM